MIKLTFEERVWLEYRVWILMTRLAAAEEHVRVGTSDGRNWTRRRDYLIVWLDEALADLHTTQVAPMAYN